MTDYEALAAKGIVAQLNYAPGEIDLIGRVLSLAKDKALVRFVELKPPKTFHGHQRVLELNRPRETDLRVVLQPAVYRLSHESLAHKLRGALLQREIPSDDMFSYSKHSFGLELDNVLVRLGGTPLRTDKKLCPEDQIQLPPALTH